MSIDMTKDWVAYVFDKHQHEEFLSALEDIQKDTIVEPIKAKEVSFVPLSEVPEGELVEAVREDSATAKVVDRPFESRLPIAVHMDDGRYYCVRPYLWKNLKQHHKDNAAILGEMVHREKWGDICAHLNMSKPYLSKSILMMLRGGKISGWFSEFNFNQSQWTQVKFVEETLGEKFPDMVFEAGGISHLFTTATYQLGNSIAESYSRLGMDESILNAYLEAWVASGGAVEDLETAVPYIRFLTGESGLTSITLTPYLKLRDGRCFYLGGSLSVNHRGEDKAVWGKFEEFPDQVAVLYQNGLSGLKKLCDRFIPYPWACLTHVLKGFRATIPVKEMKDCLDDFEMWYDPDDEEQTCRAIDVYNAVASLVNELGAKNGPMRQIQNQELVARLLVANWDEYDKKTPAKLFGKREDTAKEFDWLSL